MDLDGQDSAKGTGEQDRQVSNIVQFPRDWIGPTEELIPFGPRADRVAVEEPPELPSASDFWGEHAAAIHSVLEDPSVEGNRAGGDHHDLEDPSGERAAAESIPVAAPTACGDRLTPRRQRGRSRLRVAVRREPRKSRLRSARRIVPLLAAHTDPRQWHLRIGWRVVLGTTATGLLVVLALGESGHRTQTPGRPARASAEFLASTGRRLSTSEGIVGVVRHEQVRAAAIMQRPRVVRRLASTHHRATSARRSRSARANTSASGTTVVVHYTPARSETPRATYVAPSTSSGSTATTAVGTSSTTGTSASGSGGGGSSGTSRGSGTTGSTSSAAGPVGAGAPFGPGHLG